VLHLNIKSTLLRPAVAAALIACIAPQVRADDAPAVMSRVRSDDSSIARLIGEATTASVTFRRLVETIDGSDGIVYIDKGRCGHSVRACLIMSVGIAGPHRILRVVVDAGRPRAEVIASIGHELQHVVEVLGDPGVTNHHAMFYFFERRGLRRSNRFETVAAIEAGIAVGREIQQLRALPAP
jgi:hypothetical protein